MRTTVTRTALAILVALALATATAQTQPLIEQAARVIANDMDAVMTACPTPKRADVPPRACFLHPLGMEWARMEWDSLVSEYNDLAWAAPWEADATGVLSRYLRKTSHPTMLMQVWIASHGAYDAIILILHVDAP